MPGSNECLKASRHACLHALLCSGRIFFILELARNAVPKLQSRRARILASRVQRGAWRHAPAEIQIRKRKLDESGLPYRLEELKAAPLPSLTIQKGLQQKNADVKFLSEVFNAANMESGKGMSKVTQRLIGRGRESAFHRYWSRSLPKVSSVDIPILLSKQKKRVGIRKCSSSVAASRLFCVPVPIEPNYLAMAFRLGVVS